jgi:hypothetical protein
MAVQARLPILPEQARVIGPELAVVIEDGLVSFFNGSGPIYTCREDDRTGVRLAIAMFSDPELGVARTSSLTEAMGVHRNRASEYRRRYQEDGVSGLLEEKRGPRSPHKLKGVVKARAQRLLNEGLSKRDVAKKVGVSEGTIRYAVRQGRLVVPAERATRAPQNLTPPSRRSETDLGRSGGVAVKRDAERALARAGMLQEAAPQFAASEAVPKAGVLVALPALLGQGLLEAGKVYGALSGGFYGLTSILLTFAFMALLRIKTIENLSSHAPGELGLILGLDRAPEVKTVRRKLAELGRRGVASEFAASLTRRWANDQPEALGYLYVDGHVRAYNGTKHKLPKTHVQRRRLCMPATTDYWVNDANAEPLFFVTAPANEGLLAMMDSEVLPQVRELAGSGRRVTLIFDREGWSPDRFKRWSQDEDFDVLTYRKGKYETWPEECFSEVETTVSGNPVVYRLGERSILVRKNFWMREVRRLCDDGHQTSVVTTRQDLSIVEVAKRMFSRWQQENFFRYMRNDFDLDHMPTSAVESADADRLVPNPVKNHKKKELAAIKAQLGKAIQELGKAAADNPERKRRTMRGFKIAHAPLSRGIRKLQEEAAALEEQMRSLPDRIPVSELIAPAKVVRLERERKVFTDAVKMAAYRAETQLANLIGPLLRTQTDEARIFLKQVFQLPANLIPNREQGCLFVHLHGMSTWRANRTLAALCETINEYEVNFPGTDLRLVLVPPNAR